jgi:aegerolysin
MAYRDWIEVELVASNYTIQIRNAEYSWGKFYRRGNKDDDISPGDIDKIIVWANSGQSAYICACGRDSSASGTEGSFEIWDGQNRVGLFKWDCPYINPNSASFQPDHAGYVTTIPEISRSGHIGAIKITTVAALLSDAQGMRVSGFTALQSSLTLYQAHPAASAIDMAVVLVQVWACELSSTGLVAALQACVNQNGGRAYTDSQIDAAVAAAMSLVFWDVAHLPTQDAGVVNSELKMIGLAQGDLTAIKPAEAAQFLVISTLPGDYSPTPGSMIAGLQNAYGVNVASMVADPAADYRSTNHCWISKPFALTSAVPYRQLICFEASGANAVAWMPGVFAAIKQYVPAPPALHNPGVTVASAMLSTGAAGADPAKVLAALFNGCWDLMTAGYNMSSFRIGVHEAGQQQQMVSLFDQLKKSRGG